ncbi:MAG TPA: nucleotidyl transferase AbiEii/AbiGii toxin family protein [Thermoanaerobaculia bacterium]|nr:nucleotidyl transferase AbiEii/AbiGii toxin family protein [Thermoanaerobaculia bacterium]
MFRAKLGTLPSAQRRLWDELGSVPRRFVLYGGTALALRFGHRSSEDFDFFSNQPFAATELEAEIALLQGAVRLQSSANTLVSRVDRGGPVKVSFFGGLALRRVRDPQPVEGLPGLRVASPLDLAATKVKVVQDRAESKDYRDIGRLLEEGIGLAEALGAAGAVYGPTFNPLPSLKALCFFGDGDLAGLPQDLRALLVEAVSAVDPIAIPQISPLPGGIAP